MGANQAPIRVLFVCLGNICRSPMAEGVFRHLVEQAGLSGRIVADSAGTGAWHVGERPHHGTRRVLRQRGIDYSHVARVIGPEDIARFDYLVAMDSDNLYALRRMTQRAPVQPRLLMEYAAEAAARDVPDPYYNGRFDEVYDLVELGCRGLLEEIRREHRM